MDTGAYIIGALIGALISGVVCGLVCQAIASSRHMDGGFWWGFFLGIIGVIIVTVRANDKQTTSLLSSIFENQVKEQKLLNDITQSLMDLRKNNLLIETPASISPSHASAEASQTFEQGSWTCKTCGKTNKYFVLKCSC